jgi:uncharacterized membrane protein
MVANLSALLVALFGRPDLLFRLRGRGWGHGGHAAEDVLAERYARGEIEVDEYRERLRVLKQPGS